MSEKFEYSFDMEDVVSRAFLISIVGLSKENQDKVLQDSDGFYDVSLTINGVECSFTNIITRFADAYQDCVEEKALQILKERIGDAEEKMQNIINEARDKMKEQLGFSYHGDDDDY